ncbi:MAG: hypothetical protein A2992_07075 [Elusimicrobia bacterium RIFCSPLOWO2_01_FULL_59_12]|nr:MAG: hypothetical protein A2992_07075 [Elusimicrobia bacterium RIFCSPLOWO2_01_FULL_59_12]
MSPGRLAIMPRPRGGVQLVDEVLALREENVDVLVSLLSPEEVEEWTLQQEHIVCKAQGIEFIHFPVPDHGVPEVNQNSIQLIQSLVNKLARGESIVLHCRMGVGRSSLLAACVLAARGVRVDSAFSRIAEARGRLVPDTEAQYDWLSEFTQSPAFRLVSTATA